jgi:hypothetical protein
VTADEARAAGRLLRAELASLRALDPSEHVRLRPAVTATVTAHLGEPPDEVVIAPPRSILKTSSGKIRRLDTRTRYERGEIGRSPRRKWWRRALRLGLRAALGPVLLRCMRGEPRPNGSTGFTLGAYSCRSPCSRLVVRRVVAAPSLGAGGDTAACARALVRTGFIRLRVVGQEQLPAVGGWVLVTPTTRELPRWPHRERDPARCLSLHRQA